MTTELTRMIARLLLLPALTVSAAILVKGYADVGDGFAAGTVAAAALVVQYAAFGHEEVERRLSLRHAARVAYAGLGLAVAVAFVPLLGGSPPLTHAPAAGAEAARLGTLELVTAVVFDVAVFLLVVGAVVAVVHAVLEASAEETEDP